MRARNIYLLIGFLFLFIYGCSGSELGNLPTQPWNKVAADSFTGNVFESNTIPAYERDTWAGTIEIDGLEWMADLMPDGRLRWAGGEGIPVDDPIAFIDAHPDIFKIPGGSLHTVCDEMHGDVRYAIYRQLVDGIELIDKRIDLRIKFGKLILIGVDVAEDLRSLPAPAFSYSDAAATALLFHPEGPIHACRIFAKEFDSGWQPYWRVHVNDFYMEISAVDGYVIVDREFLWDGEYYFTGEVSGYVSEVDPFDEFPLTGLFNLDVFFYEESTLATTDIFGQYYSDSDGYYEQLTHVTPVGPWAEIDRYDYTTAYIEELTHDGVFAEFTFDDDNSAHSERTVFYWTNIGHDYAKNIEPDFTGLDRVIISSVERKKLCNAMAGWGVMYYYKAKPPCINLSWIPDVVLHEYGHEFTFFHYWEVDESECPSDIHEGFADYYAATVTDQPIIGTNWKGPGTHIRNCDNTLWWPNNNCGGECHCLGQILAGALWDVRELLGREYTDHLWHFSRYGTPMTFPEVAMEMCVVDDDDGDLDNGTPHFTELYTAFDKIHGIPMPDAPDYIDIEFEVIPDEDDITISRATGGSFGYTIHITNLIGQQADFEAWVAVKRPIGLWYGPIVPPSHYIGIPPTLHLIPYKDFQYHITQNIPPGLPLAAIYEYHVRLGDYIDLENDIIIADDSFTFQIVD